MFTLKDQMVKLLLGHCVISFYLRSPPELGFQQVLGREGPGSAVGQSGMEGYLVRTWRGAFSF